MSHGDDCRIGSSQCDILEITEILMNILVSFFVQPLFHACTFYFGSFYQKFDEIFFKLCYFFGIVLNKFTKPLKKQLHFSFFSCKNRICHHNFKLIAWNNGWIKKKPIYSSESPWFPEYYIGWIQCGNRHHETSRLFMYY